MDIKDTAAQDQADAKEREFNRFAQRWAYYFLVSAFIAGVYCWLASLGAAPAAPWSPLGK